MLATNTHDTAVWVPALAVGVDPGGSVDVDVDVARSLAAAGWSVPDLDPASTPTKRAKATTDQPVED